MEIRQKRRKIKGRRVFGGLEVELSGKCFFIETELANELFSIEEDEASDNITIFDIIGGNQHAES